MKGFLGVGLLLAPALVWAECVITWPACPTEDNCTQYNLYVDGVLTETMVESVPVRIESLGIDATVPHVFEMSAVNAGGEGPKSEPYNYTPPPIPVPGQVGAPTAEGCA